MAFVVLTHRGADQPCYLVEILSGVTRMPVRQIKNRSALSPNCVHVIPPGKYLTTDGTLFRLAPISTAPGRREVFDLFLNSLARNTRGRAVTIILSGMARDGSAVLRELSLSGGVNFAQSDATITGMPTSAVVTGHIDYHCSAADIGVLVSALAAVSFRSRGWIVSRNTQSL